MAHAELSHRDTLISGPVALPAVVRMLHVGKYSVDTHVWIAVIPCGGDGVLVLLPAWALPPITLAAYRQDLSRNRSRRRPANRPAHASPVLAPTYRPGTKGLGRRPCPVSPELARRPAPGDPTAAPT